VISLRGAGRVPAGCAALAILLAACPSGERPEPQGPAAPAAAPEADAAAREGMRLLQSGAVDAAEPLLVRALAARPRDARLLEAVGQVYARSDRFGQAETSYRQALEADPASPGARLGLARLLGDMGRNAEGLEVLAPLLTDRGDAPPVLLQEARLRLRAGDSAGGLKAARRAAEREPRSAEAQYLIGLGLEAAGEREEALAAFERAAEIDPGHLGALSHVRTLAARLGRAEKAAQAGARHQAALDRRRVDERVRSHRIAGVEAFNRQEYGRALEEFRIIAREDPADPQAQLFIGSSLLALDRRDEARRALDRSLQLDPRGERAWLEMGRLLALENRLDEAVTALRRAAEIEPEFAEPHYFLSGILQARGDAGGARSEMARYEELRRRTPDGGMQLLDPRPGAQP